MERVVERAAGLDVHRDTVTACVRLPAEGGGRRQEVDTFATTTRQLLRLRDWLAEHGVTRVGMESTGIYWKPVFYLLEGDFECWLINAQHLHHVPGRKTDVRDAEWICELVEFGLVRPSFVPPREIRELRDLTRYRKSVIEERAREVQRLHKVLEDAGIKLSSVASKVLSASGRAMLEALAGGERDPVVLAEFAKGRMRSKIPQLREALEGRFRTHHAIIVAEMLARIDHADDSIERISQRIDEVIRPFAQQVELLCTIPGVQQRTAEVILAEIGADMSRFPDASHLASWAGMCPGNNESAGKHKSGKTRKGSKWLRKALVEAAHAAARSKGTYLASQYHRIRGRRGPKKAAVAVGHSILVITYHLLQRNEPYSDLGADYLLQRQSNEAYKNRLVRQLERMGHKVTLEPAQAA
ncbi:MAG TPA: IS110 family transposase [Rubrobacteraceae bacterium]|nr:IS110 family transposase [Rubrobacteraceae bacterium]